MNSSTLTDRLVAFWLQSSPSLEGEVRIALYGSLLLAALFDWIPRPPLGDSPIKAPELWRATAPSLRRVMLRVPWTYSALVVVRALVVLAWCMVVAGLGGHLPVVVVGVGYFALMTCSAGATGITHRWVAPLYVLGALTMCNANHSYSLDAYFTRVYGEAWPFPPTQSVILRSGFGVKLATISLIYTLWAGGVSKLKHGGLRWMDGRSIAFYTSSPLNGYSPFVKKLISEWRSIALALSIKTIIFELGSAAAIFYQPLTLPVALAAAGFHFGIWLTMWPNYLPQTLCYMVMIDWRDPLAMGATPALEPIAPTLPVLYCVGFGCVALAALMGIAFAGFESWPFSCIPMYSFYRGTDFHPLYVQSPEQLIQLVAEQKESGLPHTIGWFDSWLSVKMKTDILSVVAVKKVFRSQLADAVREDVVSKVAAGKPLNALNVEGPAYRWLRDCVAPALKGKEDGVIQVVCNMRDGPCVMAEYAMSS